MGTLCQYDRECLTSQACYTNVSWYNSNSGENGCLCSTYYGWSGAACDEVGITMTSRVWLGFGIVTTTIVGLTMVVAVSLITRLHWLKLISFKAETVGTCQLILSCWFGLAHEIGSTWAAYAPSFGGYIPGSADNDRQNQYHRLWQAFNAIFVILSFGAAMTIALVWIEVATKAKLLSKTSNSPSKNQMRMAVFELVIMIAMIIPLIIDWVAVASLVSYILVICLLSFYIYGYRMMTEVIFSMGSSSNDSSVNHIYKPVLKEMRRTVSWICGIVLVTTCIDTALISTVFVGWKTVSMPDPHVSTQVLLVKLLSLCVAMLNCAALHFLRQCGERQIKRQTKAISALDSHRFEEVQATSS